MDVRENLMNMGFDAASVSEALRQCNNSLTDALDLLLSSKESSADSYRPPENTLSYNKCKTVHCPTSQYTVVNGNSACTCIALTAASKLLTEICRPHADSIVDDMSSEILSSLVVQGADMYEIITTENDNGSDHFSPEEVLEKCPFIISEHVKLIGLKSCVLSSTTFLTFLRESCLKEPLVRNDQYLAIVLVKPPETLLVLLPPQNEIDSPFILVDSHPRPPQCEGSYAKFFDDLDDLSVALTGIFPVVSLGQDVDEMMNIMYNSVDGYLFQLNTA